MEDKMPTEEEINRRYLLVLDHLLVSSSKQEQLIKSESLDKKWRMIKMHSDVYDNDETSKHLRWGDKEIKLIKDVHREKSPDIYKILELKNLLSTSNKEWMVEFIGAGGIVSLLNCAESRLVKVPISELDAGILFELLSCFKILTNVSIGMEAVLELKGSIDVIASCLRFEWKPLVTLVLEILSVCCYYSSAATDMVLKGLHNLARSRMEAPMAILANAMLDQDVDVKAAIFQLVNTILGGLEDVQNRGYFRGELMAQRFLELYERGITEATEASVISQSTKDNTKANETQHLSTLSASFGRSFRHARQMSFTAAAPALPTAAVRRATSVRYTRNATGALELQQRGAISEKMKGGIPSNETDSHQKNPEIVQGESDSQRNVFASDGNTFIDPLQGVMSGNLYTSLTGNIVKDVFGGKRTKQRWYSLDMDRLSWCADSASIDQWQGTLDISTIVDIRHYSTDKYLSADFNHTFEIETTDRTHSFACVEAGDKDAWLTALQVAKDSSILKKTSYILQSNVLSHEETLSYLDMLRKQAAVFESIAVEDRHEMIVLNGVDANNPMSIMSYLQRDTQLAGLQPQLLALLQELLLVPTDSVRGAGIWHAMVGGLRCLRSQAVSTSKDSEPTNIKSTTGTAAAGSVLISNRDAFEYLTGVFGEVSLADSLVSKMMTTHPGGRRQSDVSKLSIALDAREQEIKRLKEILAKTHPEYSTSTSSSSSLGSEEDLLPPRPLFGSPNGTMKSQLADHQQIVPVATTEAVVDPKYAMYIKMKKILPEHVLRSKMKLGGLSENEIDYFFNGMSMVAPTTTGNTQENDQLVTPTKSNNKYSDDSRYSKFIKMKSMLPEMAVRQKMTMEGFSDTEIDHFLNDTNAASKSTNETNTSLANETKGGGVSVQDDPKYAKYDKMCTMFPEAAVRQRMVQDGIVTTEIEAYLSKRNKAATGNAQSSNAPKAPSEMDRVPDGMTPKPKVAPTKKMKGFFWTKLAASDVEKSIWHRQVPDFSLTNEDKENLQQWFGVIGANGGLVDATTSTPGNNKNNNSSQNNNNNSNSNSRTSGRPDPTPTVVILLEGKRSQNVLIALGKLRLNANQIRESIYKLTPESLPHENTETLLSILPTTEEISLISGYPRPVALGRAETLFLMLSGIPRLTQRLTCHEIVFRWGYDERATSRDITVLREACKELRASEAHFGQVFGMVLTVGNFLNGGTPRGQAYGFRLEALLKLTNLKCTTVQNGTFLHFVIKQLEEKSPSALRLGTSWNDLWMAGDISVHELEKEIKVLEDQIKFIKKERGEGLTEIRTAVGGGGGGWADGLAARIDGFVVTAEAKLHNLKAEMAQTQEEIQQVIARFGEKSIKSKGTTTTAADKEDEDDDPIKTFFKLISTFGKLFRQSIADVEAERAIAELAIKKEEAKAKRRSSKREDNIFKNFHQDQNARQEDMIARFKERLQRSTIHRK